MKKIEVVLLLRSKGEGDRNEKDLGMGPLHSHEPYVLNETIPLQNARVADDFFSKLNKRGLFHTPTFYSSASSGLLQPF